MADGAGGLGNGDPELRRSRLGPWRSLIRPPRLEDAAHGARCGSVRCDHVRFGVLAVRSSAISAVQNRGTDQKCCRCGSSLASFAATFLSINYPDERLLHSIRRHPELTARSSSHHHVSQIRVTRRAWTRLQDPRHHSDGLPVPRPRSDRNSDRLLPKARPLRMGTARRRRARFPIRRRRCRMLTRRPL